MELDRESGFSELFVIPLSSARSGVLVWSKVPHGRDYELRLNGHLVGQLSRPRAWSTNFVAETESRSWNFRRGGLLGTEAEVIDSRSGKRLAQFKARWGKGILAFADGQKFRVESKGIFRAVWSAMLENGQPCLEVHAKEKTVDMMRPASSIPDERLTLLIMFLWYRKLQADEDAGGSAVGAS
jgi:hypothetical protein